MNSKELKEGRYYIMEGMDVTCLEETTIVRFNCAGYVPILGSKIGFWFSTRHDGTRMLLEESIEIAIQPIPDYMQEWVELFFDFEKEDE